ncbi:hypothetical protein RDABS01_011109 [Bienertia sinuspersici]
MQSFPADPIISHYEHDISEKLKGLKKAYGSLLSQREKIRWLKYGDENSKYFHQAIKVQQYRKKIVEIKGVDGKVRSTQQGIEEAFELFYQELLGNKVAERSNVHSNIVQMGPIVTQDHARNLLQEVTDAEIKKTIFSIPGNKAPGPDGFNSTFFKSAWNEVGLEVCEAIKDFFRTGVMLKELNSTKLTLIPK